MNGALAPAVIVSCDSQFRNAILQVARNTTNLCGQPLSTSSQRGAPSFPLLSAGEGSAFSIRGKGGRAQVSIPPVNSQLETASAPAHSHMPAQSALLSLLQHPRVPQVPLLGPGKAQNHKEKETELESLSTSSQPHASAVRASQPSATPAHTRRVPSEPAASLSPEPWGPPSKNQSGRARSASRRTH